MVKKSGLLGGQGKLPTIVSPKEYKNRFIEAMHKYFLVVPDHWAGLEQGLDCLYWKIIFIIIHLTVGTYYLIKYILLLLLLNKMYKYYKNYIIGVD